MSCPSASTFVILPKGYDSLGRWYHPEGIRRWLVEHNDHRLYGQIGHCETALDVSKVSHVFKDIRWDELNLVADLEVLTRTPGGVILQEMLDNDVQFKTSLRSIGTLHQTSDRLQAHVTSLVGIDLIIV